MGKQILILNGSPRRRGNTRALVEAFQKGAAEAGHQVDCFHLQDMDIHGCLGCCGGGKDPASPCVQKDDMGRIYPAYQAADVVVLASPMYYWNFSGQLKCAFDRLFAVAELDPNYANPKKDCVLLMAAEGDTEDNFAPVRALYEGLTARMGWKSLGIVYAGGNFEAGAVQNRPEQLREAEELGRSL